MRADRMLNILLLLQNEGKQSTGKLATKLEVSERTIVRDMEALSMAGVPVYAERGSQGGWQLSEGYRTDLTGMKNEELQALVIASHPDILSDLGMGSHYHTALQKLLASSTTPLKNSTELVRQKIHIDGAGWHQTKESCPYLTVVQEAVWVEHKLRIQYKRDEEISIRIIEPLGLVAKRSVWYVVATEYGEIKTYRISRIVHAEMLERFDRPLDFNLAEHWEHSTSAFKQNIPRYRATVHVHERVFHRLEQDRFLTVVSSREESNGWLKLEIDFADEEHACEKILGYGPYAEFSAPQELRDMMMVKLTETINRYRVK